MEKEVEKEAGEKIGEVAQNVLPYRPGDKKQLKAHDVTV